MTYYRNGHVGSKTYVDSNTANAMESYSIKGDKLSGPVSATIKPNGDIEYSHGYTSRKEEVPTVSEMGKRVSDLEEKVNSLEEKFAQMEQEIKRLQAQQTKK